MFNTIRKSIAAMIAPAQIVIAATDKELSQAKSLTYAGVAPKHDVKHDQEPIIGNFHVSHLDMIASDYFKQAICQLGAWSALARAFAEYTRVQRQKSADETKLGTLLDEFHCWNAASEKQMDEEAIIVAVDKMATVQPPKGNDQTDAIIARIRKMDIELLRRDREAKAAAQTQERKELIMGFCQAVWSFTSGDMNPSIQSAKVAAKGVQTLEWVATNWTGNPAGIAAELLLIERDIKVIEKMARDAEYRTNETFVDGTLTADGLAKNAKQGRRVGEERSEISLKYERDNQEQVLDMAAFRQWQIDNGK